MITSRTSSQLEMLLESLVSTPIRFANLLTTTKYNAIKHLPDKENIIESVWKSSVTLFQKLLLPNNQSAKELITSTHVFHLKNNWTTLLDKLNSCKLEDLNTLPMYLLQTLLLESILKEKAYKPFWTPACRELSVNLLLPIVIDSVDLDMNYSTNSLKKAEEKSQFLTTIPIEVQNKNSLKTYFQLSTSTVANKWEKEVIPTGLLKSLKIKLKPSTKQRKILDEWLNTSNYVYNKTVETIYKCNHPANFQGLRDKLVTANTKKNNIEYIEITNRIKLLSSEKNVLKKELKDLHAKLKHHMIVSLNKLRTLSKMITEKETLIKQENVNLRTASKKLSSEKNGNIQEWELNTPKEVRAGAVNDVCKAIKTGISNLKVGNIRHFRLGFRKKTESHQCVLIPKNFIKNKYGKIQLAPEFFKEDCFFKMGKNTLKKHKKLEINYDSRIIKNMNSYWLIVPIPVIVKEKTTPVNYCGIDPGSRTFMTVFGNNGCMEYEHNETKLKFLDKKISVLKNRALDKNKRIPKQKITKIEQKKENYINELHWKVIKNIVSTNDFIFYGDIKSHDIVKNGKNRTLNTSMNNLKFYKFKQRLLFKATEHSKKVFVVNEAFTTQTCSFCGTMYKPECSKIYSCGYCKRKIGRDVNAAKNMLIKGIKENL